MEEKMKRGQRLEDMKNLIYSGKKLHADELAVRYRISRRLIFKDLKYLREHMDVEYESKSGPDGYIRAIPGDRYYSNSFTFDEVDWLKKYIAIADLNGDGEIGRRILRKHGPQNLKC